jgi:UDP-GlcNAc3NAcA epimerase
MQSGTSLKRINEWNPMKIATIIGARPQFIKAAVVSKEIARLNRNGGHIKEIIIHTGQHYDNNMSKLFFDELKIKNPDYNLNVGSFSQGKQTGLMLERLEETLVREKPDWTIVYGDTNSTLAGALASSKLHVPLAHVEAGLRSFNRNMPEEINRIVADHLSNILFCPTRQAVINLKNEGINQGVLRVGDVMYDSVLHYSDIAQTGSQILEKLKVFPKNYYLTTIHRAENTDDIERLKSILSALSKLDLRVIFPIHPRTAKFVKNLNKNLKNIFIIEPVSYLDMLKLERNASAILTDSGGIQKEAFYLKVPCITLRDETEWVETVKSGKNIIAGTNESKILKSLKTILSQKSNYYPPFYGDGKAAKKILEIILKTKISG